MIDRRRQCPKTGFCLLLLLALFAPTVAARAQRLPPGELPAFFDRALASEMAKDHVPGAVVVVVENDQVVFSQGYGVADLATRRPVSPEQTIFRVASVTKPITAAAVLDLAGQGRLDLRADVNRYLTTFRMPATFSRPVTLADLLTHTAGFDELYIGTAARTAAEQRPLGRYLATQMPPRIMPPGRVISYSNHGFALAGFVVEQVSGVPFEAYMAAHVFAPLGMSHSAFRLDDRLRPALAVGYRDDRRGVHPVPYDYLNDLPAAGLLTTGADIAQFMLAQLDDGRHGGHRVFVPGVAGAMLQRQFAASPWLPGRTYGYFEMFRNHERIVGQEGDVRGFASAIYLLPEHRLGLFIAANQSTPLLREHLLQGVLDRWFPERAVADAAGALARPAASTGNAAGSYRLARNPHSTIDKIAALLGFAPELAVVAARDGGLDFAFPGGEVVPTVEVEPGFFQRRGHVDRTSGKGFALHRDRNGRYDFAFLGEFAYERLNWYETARVQLTLLAVLLGVFLAVSLLLPLRRLRRSRRDAPGPGLMERVSGRLAFAISLLNLLFFGGLVAVLARTDPYEFTYGVPASVKALLLIPPLTGLMALVLPVVLALSWRGRTTLGGWLLCSAASLAGLLIIPGLLYWNLFSFKSVLG